MSPGKHVADVVGLDQAAAGEPPRRPMLYVVDQWFREEVHGSAVPATAPAMVDPQ